MLNYAGNMGEAGKVGNRCSGQGTHRSGQWTL